MNYLIGNRSTREERLTDILTPVIWKWQTKIGKRGFLYVSIREMWRNLYGSMAPFKRGHLDRLNLYTLIAEASAPAMYTVPVRCRINKLPESLDEARRLLAGRGIVGVRGFKPISGFVIINKQDGWLHVASTECHSMKLGGGLIQLQRRNLAIEPLLSKEVKNALDGLNPLLLNK